jgi:hypothetical protein
MNRSSSPSAARLSDASGLFLFPACAALDERGRPHLDDAPEKKGCFREGDPKDEPLNERHASRGQGMMLAPIGRSTRPFTFAWEERAV